MDRLHKNYKCKEELLHRLSTCDAQIALDLKIVIEWASFYYVAIMNGTSSSPQRYRA